jgi:hypothetical protein
MVRVQTLGGSCFAEDPPEGSPQMVSIWCGLVGENPGIRIFFSKKMRIRCRKATSIRIFFACKEVMRQKPQFLDPHIFIRKLRSWHSQMPDPHIFLFSSPNGHHI